MAQHPLTDFPETRESLIAQIRDPEDQDAWNQFVGIYRPIVQRLAIRRGLQPANAQDLAQQVLISVAGSIGRYQTSSSPVRFRHWIRRVARNAIINALTRQPADVAAGGSDVLNLLDEVPQPDQLTADMIAFEYRRELYLRAAEMVQVDVANDTWVAFEMTVFDGVSVEAASGELGKSVGSIHAARSRVMKRLRDAVRTLEENDQ